MARQSENSFSVGRNCNMNTQKPQYEYSSSQSSLVFRKEVAMEKKLCVHTLFVALAILTCFGVNEVLAQAPRYVNVPSGIGTLNNVIAGDSTARRQNPNTWYVLERDGYYLVSTPIQNIGFHLQIMAAEGTGRKPIVRPNTVGGVDVSRCFEPFSSLTLKGLYVSAMSAGGTLIQNNVRTKVDSVRLTFTDCHFDRDQTAVVRFDTRWCKVYFRRNYFTNLGLAWDGNGRGIDDRGNDVDTIVVEDNVYYNLTGRFMRDGGGRINWLTINHNTFINLWDRVGIGEAAKAYITNNLFWNHGFRGHDTVGRYFFETKPLLVGGPQVLDIHHNNFYLHSAMISAYPTTPVGPVRPIPNFDSVAQSFIDRNGFGPTNTTQSVTFTNGPLNEIGYMLDQWSSTPPTSWREFYMGPDSGRGTWGVDQVPFNLRYSTNNPLYTMGTNGTPMGAMFVFGLTLGVDNNNEVPRGYSLSQNYPNPFNPSTTIEFSIPQREFVTLRLYNMLGQNVQTLIAQTLEEGTHHAALTGSQLASGVYFYRFRAGNFSETKKLTILK